jgi:hypothetical protein
MGTRNGGSGRTQATVPRQGGLAARDQKQVNDLWRERWEAQRDRYNARIGNGVGIGKRQAAEDAALRAEHEAIAKLESFSAGKIQIGSTIASSMGMMGGTVVGEGSMAGGRIELWQIERPDGTRNAIVKGDAIFAATIEPPEV